MKAVNLIPSDQRRARPSGGGSGGGLILIGVLAVLLAMLVVYVLTSNTLGERETKAQEARQHADALEAQASQKESFTDFASIKDQRLGSVIAAAGARFDWERLMRELALVMPEGSWLQSTSASVSGDPDASATATTTIAAPASPTATLVGCTPKQSEVAKMMLRLRQLHRVSDVTLNESALEQGSTEVTVDSCGRLWKFDLTVSFEPGPPATDTPRGSDSVPASLGGGS